jgi:hypothetical protein
MISRCSNNYGPMQHTEKFIAQSDNELFYISGLGKPFPFQEEDLPIPKSIYEISN